MSGTARSPRPLSSISPHRRAHRSGQSRTCRVLRSGTPRSLSIARGHAAHVSARTALRAPGVQRCVHGDYPSFYRVREAAIDIVRILHGAQDLRPFRFRMGSNRTRAGQGRRMKNDDSPKVAGKQLQQMAGLQRRRRLERLLDASAPTASPNDGLGVLYHHSVLCQTCLPFRGTQRASRGGATAMCGSR